MQWSQKAMVGQGAVVNKRGSTSVSITDALVLL